MTELPATASIVAATAPPGVSAPAALPVMPDPPRGVIWRRRRGPVRLAGRGLNWLEGFRFRRRIAFDVGSTTDRRIRRISGWLRVVQVVPGATSSQVRVRNRDIVVSLCEQFAIPYFVVPLPDERRGRVGIADEHWSRFTDALVSCGRGSPLYVGVAARQNGKRARWSELISDPRAAQAARDQRELEIFRIVTASESTTPFFGRPLACVVERWHRLDDGSLVAPTRNARASSIDASAQQSGVTYQWGRRVATFDILKTRNMFDIDFPIDAVYMWVDGGDPEWLARKAAALQPGSGVDGFADDDVRFRDNGELRYSLRSLHEYAPWFRRVYLVTDKQVPPWLSTFHPQLQVVDHTEIFDDEGTLPSFNSHAIGGRLHHIAGLSEHYIHMNDDFFFGREVFPHTFFHSNGASKFFLSRSTLKVTSGETEAKHEDARRNVVNLLGQDFGRWPSRTFFHTPIPQRRSVLFDLEDRYRPHFEATWSHQFRHSGDIEINSWLHHYYSYLVGSAVPGSISYDYFDLTDEAAWTRMRRLSHRRLRDVFCINDTSDTAAEQRTGAAKWLESYFPRPSPFEGDTKRSL